MTDIGVVVCTRDRPQLLARALASLSAQTLPRTQFAVVVVDNGDGSGVEVAAAEGADVVLHEAEPGLSRARNVGWQAVDAPLVAFLDDDAEAPPEWLAQALAVVAAHGAVAAGGPILPRYETPPPAWFRDEYELRTWGSEPRLLRRGESLSGSNLVVARTALAAVGGFDERLGMRGDRVAVGEETAFFEDLWRRAGTTVAYSPALAVRHLVAPSKTTVAYQLRRAAAAGEAWASRQDPQGAARVRRAAADAAAAAALSARAVLRFRRPVRQWLVEELAPVAGRLGSLRSVVR